MHLSKLVLCLALPLIGTLQLANEPESDKADDPLTRLIATSHHAMTPSDEGLPVPEQPCCSARQSSRPSF